MRYNADFTDEKYRDVTARVMGKWKHGAIPGARDAAVEAVSLLVTVMSVFHIYVMLVYARKTFRTGAGGGTG